MVLIYILFLSYWVKKMNLWLFHLWQQFDEKKNVTILLFKTEHFSLFMNFFIKFSF